MEIKIRDFVQEWKAAIKEKVAGRSIVLAIVQVGNNEASNRYVKNKLKDCEEVGITGKLYKFDEDIKKEDFIKQLCGIVDAQPQGLIVQLPLPAQLQDIEFDNYIPAWMDVDGFGAKSLHKPCTPSGIVAYLRRAGIEVAGKHAVVLGRSEIVGKPMAKMLTDLDCTVTLCHSKTQHLEKFIEMADLIIVAVGKAKFLDCSKIVVPVIDVGINFVDGKLVGDCYNGGENVTPVPGGVGLLTRCALLENVVKEK